MGLVSTMGGWTYEYNCRVLNDGFVAVFDVSGMTPEQEKRLEMRLKAIVRHNARHIERPVRLSESLG